MDLVPAQSAAPYTSIASSLPPTAEPTVARSAPSQLLQVQPIFQPPSSAELDSLFSTYFFDVADAFNTRSNGVYPPGLPPPHQAQPSHLYPHQQHPAANTTSHPANIAPMPHQHSMLDPLSAGTIAHNHVQTHQRPARMGTIPDRKLSPQRLRLQRTVQIHPVSTQDPHTMPRWRSIAKLTGSSTLGGCRAAKIQQAVRSRATSMRRIRTERGMRR